MADTTAQGGPMLAADGTPLKQSLARALRRQKLRALMLVAPLLLFILLSFIAPIARARLCFNGAPILGAAGRQARGARHRHGAAHADRSGEREAHHSLQL